MFSFLLKIVKWLFISLLVCTLLISAFVNFAPTFGGKPDASSQAKIASSSNFNGEVFENLYPTQVETRTATSPSLMDTLMSLLNPAKNKNPQQPLISKTLNAKQLTNGDFVWLGHSTVLFKTNGKTIITDPIFHRASPIPLGGKAFAMQNPTSIDDLPPLDAVLISHDHYDHLDHLAIQKLAKKVQQFYVPLGIKGHLQHWGVSDDKITELDWYEFAKLGEVTLTLTPSRHFSGRGLTNRFSTLWGSWVVQSPSLSVYFSGDGGYSPEFKKIGQQFGGFDIAFMEDGAYNDDWAQIHMSPEQAAQAAADLNAKVLLPVHWGKFDLARHQWKDPIERISTAAKVQGVQLATPIIGEPFRLATTPTTTWWKAQK